MDIRKFKKKMKFKYISSEALRVYYASYTPDGEVWCSGRNPYEVIGMSSHISGITYTKLEYFEVTNGDQPWTPSEELINHKQCTVYANLSKDDEDDSTE